VVTLPPIRLMEVCPMPRYFFHVHDGVDQPDTEGVEFPSPEDARTEAVTAMGEALRDLDGAFWRC
jgi:hypothetical protein